MPSRRWESGEHLARKVSGQRLGGFVNYAKWHLGFSSFQTVCLRSYRTTNRNSQLASQDHYEKAGNNGKECPFG